MGRAIELITAINTAPGATPVAAAAVSGNSFTVRDSRRPIKMIGLWTTRQANGVARIVSPRLHDNVIGIQVEAGAGTQVIHSPVTPQLLYAQDLLSVQQSGSAVAGDIEHASYLVAYDDLPGVDSRFISATEMNRRAVNLYMQVLTLTPNANGGYSGSVAMSSAEDSFKANTSYALCGYQVNGNQCHAVRFVGPDWGNLGVGGPGRVAAGRNNTDKWFLDLSDMYGAPAIPVMNSANKGLTTVDVVQNENAAAPIVTLIWVELS